MYFVSRKWSILPFLFIFLQLSFALYGPHREKTSSLLSTDCSQVCSGTNDGMAHLHKDEPGRYVTKLKQIYENCTKVLGNLELVRITEKGLLDAGVSSLDFLKDIEEVYGYVLIGHTHLKEVPLPKLKIIWGDSLYVPPRKGTNDTVTTDPYGKALSVFNNPQLEYIDFSSLREIHKGHVSILYNPNMCWWNDDKGNVDWRQVLGDTWRERYTKETSKKIHGNGQCNWNFCGCSLVKSYNCSPDCSDGHCWGPEAGMCQKVYRDNCAPQCVQGMCFEQGKDFRSCCHDDCAAGCTGPLNHQCLACKHSNNNGTCVKQCPRRTFYDTKLKKNSINADGKFAYGRECVSKCPDHMDIFDDACVNNCPSGYYAAREDRNCRQCLGACPKRCVITQALSSKNIDDFINCTVVQGFIEIRQDKLKGGADISPETGQIEEFDPVTVEQLDNLKDVKHVTDYVIIQSRDTFRNLNFLSGLEIIEGKTMHLNMWSLEITGNDELRELNLINLRSIERGQVYISQNIELCHVNTLPWNDKISKSTSAKISNNRADDVCLNEGRVCDEKCENGCWGMGSRQCFSCRQYKLEMECVADCREDEGFFVSGNKTCNRCDSTCLRCSGPGPKNCTACQHVRLNDRCLERCPTGFYEKEGFCTPCHTNCTQKGCTGPTAYQGQYGCNECKYGVIEHGKIHCLAEICHNANLLNYFPAAPGRDLNGKISSYVCEKCSPACSSCTYRGTGIDNHGCKCNRYKEMSNNGEEKCVLDCDKTITFKEVGKSENAPLGVCRLCSNECKGGCTGPDSTDCKECYNLKDFYDDSKKKFNCTSVCPTERPYFEANICSDVDRERLARANKTRYIILAGSIIAAVLIVLLCVAVCCFSYRRKWQLQKNLNELPPELTLGPINPDAKPNMARLRLIKEDELRRGGILGSGAFGVVYKGIWIPKGERVKVPVAIKEVQEHKPSSEQEMLEEAGLMACMDHDNLVKLVGICLSKKMMLVTQLMPLGNILDYIHGNRQKIGSYALMKWCTQIASGMEYLEEHRLVHRDLAARNVLVRRPNQVQVTDFGLAKMLDYGETEIYVDGRVPVKWLALECIRERRFTHSSDVWAFGVTVWELITFGGKPYKDVPILQIPKMLDRGERLEQPHSCTHELYMLLIKCWMVDCDSRPNFRDLRLTFERFSQDPARYLVIENDKLLRLPSYSPRDHTALLIDMLPEQDITFDYFELPASPNFDVSTPSTPLSPSSPTKPLMRQGPTFRHESVSSHRYQSDPLKALHNQHLPWNDTPSASTSGYIPNTDDDNYLVPDKHNSTNDNHNGAVTYTPVVVGPQGNTVLLPPSASANTYYNDSKFLSRPGTAVSNAEYLGTDGVQEMKESETTV